MAEKEERIFVFKTDDGCELREQVPDCNGCTFWPCDEECINRKKPITRQEAIEKIAKADWIATVCAKNQCVPVDITKEQWDEEWEKLRIDYKKVYYAGAEAALDALLEVE